MSTDNKIELDKDDFIKLLDLLWNVAEMANENDNGENKNGKSYMASMFYDQIRELTNKYKNQTSNANN